jgi:DNA polymerase-3 subunit delta
MPARPIGVDNLPDVLPPLVVLVGDEELLVARAISALSEAVSRGQPDVTATERGGAEIDGGALHELLGPSLFGDGRLIVIRAAQDVKAAAQTVLIPYLREPTEAVTIVLQHAGGAKGKALLDAARKAKALEIGVARLTRPAERVDFVRHEARLAGGRIAPDAAEALVEAVGSDLRELAAVSAQLVSDCRGSVDLDAVRAYHRGRADVTGFSVAEQVMLGNAPAALAALRHALTEQLPHVLIADALFDGVHTLARVASAGRGEPSALARDLGMPPWKIRKAQGQLRGWNEPAVRRALGVVAGVNAEVKGAAADNAYALERGVRALLVARRSSARAAAHPETQ